MSERDDVVEGEQMELLTVTNLWIFPKHVHMLGKINLTAVGRPLNLRAVVYALIAFVPVWFVLGATGVGVLDAGGAAILLWFTVPTAVVWLALRAAASGGSPHELGWALARYAWSIRTWAWREVRDRLPGRARVSGHGVRIRIAPARQVPVDQVPTEQVWPFEGFDPQVWELLVEDDVQVSDGGPQAVAPAQETKQGEVEVDVRDEDERGGEAGGRGAGRAGEPAADGEGCLVGAGHAAAAPAGGWSGGPVPASGSAGSWRIPD